MPRATQPLMRNYTGEIDTSAAYIADPAPPARLEFLVGVDLAVLSAALCYCQPALIFDSTTTKTRRFALTVPPFSVQARGHLVAWGSVSAGALQDALLIDSTTSGSLGTSYDLTPDGDTITTPNAAQGTAVFGDMGGESHCYIVTTGETVNRTPSGTMDRQLDLTEDNARTVEVVEVKNSQGFGLSVTVRSADMEVVA